jgi:hypothetical protein
MEITLKYFVLYSVKEQHDSLMKILHIAYSLKAVTPILWVTGDFSPWLKRSGSEADHSPPNSAKFKNNGALPLFPRTFSLCGA